MKLSFGPWGETLHEFVEAGIDAEKKVLRPCGPVSYIERLLFP
jgi:hypothetical protein